MGERGEWENDGELDDVPKTVLVVDDEADLRDALATFLEFEGYRVLSASDGAEALEQLEHETPDLVVLDFMMPRLDGVQVIRRVRESACWKDIPIIMTSALVPPVKDAPIGYSSFLRKPFSIDALTNEMKRLFDSPSSASNPTVSPREESEPAVAAD